MRWHLIPLVSCVVTLISQGSAKAVNHAFVAASAPNHMVAEGETGAFVIVEDVEPDPASVGLASAGLGVNPDYPRWVNVGAFAETNFKDSSGVATWVDQIELRPPIGVALPPYIQVIWNTRGSFTTSLRGEESVATTRVHLKSGGSEVVATQERERRKGQAERFLQDSYTVGDVTLNGSVFNGQAVYRFPLSGESMPWGFSLEVYAGTLGGFARADFSHTATLTSILLPDGSTPESQGFTLGFESGIPSPNLAVPEPSAFAQFGSMLLLMLSRQRRRGG